MESCFLHAARPRSPRADHPSDSPDESDEPAAPLRLFDTWDTWASVRTAPRRVLTSSVDAGLPTDMVAVARHPAFRALPEGARRSVTLQHVYRYLDFTAKLELLVVNDVLTDLATGRGSFLSPERRLDAHRMLCDESYHALVAYDLSLQLQSLHGEAPSALATPFFLRRLGALLEPAPPELRHLGKLLFVVVSETLISATLTEAAAHAGNMDVLRTALKDHAVDEGRHHAFFSRLLPDIWHRMTSHERTWAGSMVPHFIDAFLAPDLDSVRADLSRAGLNNDLAEQVIAETYDPSTIGHQRRGISARTLNYFADVGAFEATDAAEALAVLDLI